MKFVFGTKNMETKIERKNVNLLELMICAEEQYGTS